MGWLWFLLIGLAAGWLAGMIMKGRGFGLVGNLVVGVVGSFIGGYLLPVIGLYPAGLLGALITAAAGAVVLLFIVSLLKR